MKDKNLLYKRIQTLCEEKKITTADLALRSSISEKTMNEILNEKYIPSVHELLRLARTLGIRPGTLLDDQQEIGPVVNKSKKTDLAGLSALAPTKIGRQMEPFLLKILKSENPPLSSHEGEEFLFIIEGSIRLTYGKDTFELEKGDSIYYDSIVEHCVRVSEGESAQVLAVLYNPERNIDEE